MVEARRKGVKASVLCSLASAYNACEDRRQVLAGFGRPKSVEARNARGKVKSRQVGGMIDPTAREDYRESNPVPGEASSPAA